MNKLYDVLEICLQELENGVSLENILAHYPDLASELRPILKASIKARSVAVSAPSPEVFRRGRAKLLQRASEMREAKVPASRRVIPIFQRLALSIGLAAALLLSGNGLVGVSASALPGEKLYPVKRTWEDVQLLFIFNNDARDALESRFENERLHEVSELLAEGRHELIRFYGVFMQANGTSYVSGVTVMVPANLQMPVNGAAVIVTGRTNAQGFVELESIELLPDGVFVPVGQPVEVDIEDSESDSNFDSNTNSNEDSEDGINSGAGDGSNENSSDSGSVVEPEHRDDFEVEGFIESITGNTLVINGKTVYLKNAAILGNLVAGVRVEIKGYYAADGRFIVTEMKVTNSGSRGDDDDSNSDSSDDNSDSDNNGSNDNDSGSNDNDSGSNNNDHNNNDSNDNDHNDNDSNDNGGDGD